MEPFQETKSEIVATGFLDDNGQASFDLKMNNWNCKKNKPTPR
jgi:hypothetical protein